MNKERFLEDLIDYKEYLERIIKGNEIDCKKRNSLKNEKDTIEAIVELIKQGKYDK